MTEKRIHIAFADISIKHAFEKLKEDKFEERKLSEFISRAINDLKKNPFCGTRIQKKIIPKEYIRKYGVTNLLKYDLPNAWRLLYTIKEDEVAIISIILEWLDHKEYERRFGYG